MVLRVWHVALLAVAAAAAGGLILLGSLRSSDAESASPPPAPPAPPPPAAPAPPPPSVDPVVAEARAATLRNAVPAIEAYAIDHAGYTGLTVEALRAIDAIIAADLVIAHADQRTYCIQVGEADASAHYEGPAGDVVAGPCP
jgi:hypothetical protein